jgi:hypothetical protein
VVPHTPTVTTVGSAVPAAITHLGSPALPGHSVGEVTPKLHRTRYVSVM